MLFSWWSWKIRTWSVKYEIVCNMALGEIVAVNGPFRPSVHDLVVARHPNGVIRRLRDGERALADGAYFGDSHFVTSTHHAVTRSQHQLNSMRQTVERVIRRIKVFHCMSDRWRHALKKHRITFDVVCKIVNLQMKLDPMFEENVVIP
jgi:hypothetical protein